MILWVGLKTAPNGYREIICITDTRDKAKVLLETDLRNSSFHPKPDDLVWRDEVKEAQHAAIAHDYTLVVYQHTLQT